LSQSLRRAPRLGSLYLDSFVLAAQDTARFLNRNLAQIVIDFDQTNPFAVQVARENQLRLVREFTQSQRRATREAILDGIQRGANPRQQALAFRDSIGLTETQVKAVNNYRRLLEDGDRAVFDRALRDRRFDRTIRRAIRDEKPLTKHQVETMVKRYRERYIAYRSKVIARTESLRSVHEGKNQMYRQAIESGDIDPNTLTNEWNTMPDERRRSSHATMHGQSQPFGTNFVSGSGNQAPYPGAFGVASEDIQCRCSLGTRITEIAPVEGITVEILQ